MRSEIERLWMSREKIGDFLSDAIHRYITFMSLPERQRQRMFQNARAGRAGRAERESCNVNVFAPIIPASKLVVIVRMRNECLIVVCQRVVDFAVNSLGNLAIVANLLT